MIAKVTLALLFVGSFGWNIRYDSPLKQQSRIHHHLSDPELQGNIGKVPHKTRSTIVGGNEATPHEYPWQVYIETRINEMLVWSCGGSLISDRWVLTAAHCFDREAFQRHNTIVYLGAHDLSQAEESRIRMNGNHELELHPRYNETSEYQNDIALLKLSQRIEFNNFIRPITLPCPNFKVDTGTILTTVGWGLMENNATTDVLLEVDVPVVSHAYCAYIYRRSSIPVRETNICTNTVGGHGICDGDSGGPLIHKIGGVSKIIGITSFGHIDCGGGFPDVYTEVNNYRDWIHNHTRI